MSPTARSVPSFLMPAILRTSSAQLVPQSFDAEPDLLHPVSPLGNSTHCGALRSLIDAWCTSATANSESCTAALNNPVACLVRGPINPSTTSADPSKSG